MDVWFIILNIRSLNVDNLKLFQVSILRVVCLEFKTISVFLVTVQPIRL